MTSLLERRAAPLVPSITVYANSFCRELLLETGCPHLEAIETAAYAVRLARHRHGNLAHVTTDQLLRCLTVAHLDTLLEAIPARTP